MIDPKSYFDFTGKSVLVVGASRGGIGASIAQAFKLAGGEVTITGMEEEPAETERGKFPYVQLDVTDDAAVAALAQATPKLDILINCAAISRRNHEYDLAIFQKVLEINLTGTIRISLALLPQLKESRGSVVNIGSMYGNFGSPKVPAYGASKGGIHQLTRSMAIDWAQYGIRVNAIAPGFIVTEQSRPGREDPEHVAAVNKRTPFGRWGEPDEMAGPALFLASPAASFVTGVTLLADGGYSAV